MLVKIDDLFVDPFILIESIFISNFILCKNKAHNIKY